MKKSAIILTGLFLTACVSSPDYDETLQTWVGANQTTLIDTWGNPASVNYITPNQELWTYFQDSPSGEEFCRTTFTITDGVVNDFTFEGDNCSLTIN